MSAPEITLRMRVQPVAALIRVTRRDGSRELYGPMARTTAQRTARRIRRLAEDPRSTFASVTVSTLHPPASIGELVQRDGFALYGHDWHDRVAP